ncbi:ATP-NAD kinase family protein [Paradesulfitobacterium ferrireducens]|uniref:ATP-NAD kinase family protein n=1 Tax=Paradesulfitobacterium ferrireducens TaxID=2816476 RepID=UPI001A8FF378|nr:ATP-NAD kinase family protein [Paradesulfitobacterium ferrireducens]
MPKRLGLIINPVAGIGGRVGLKGSDGTEVQRKALELGAVSRSAERAREALQVLIRHGLSFEIVTYPGEMGEETAKAAGFTPLVIGDIANSYTTSEDTVQAAADLMNYGVELLLFAGGDGTARDIYSAIGTKVPVLGIPAGVKMHSAVFGKSPKSAGQLAALVLKGEAKKVREAEVMDIDEESFRAGSVSAKLYGYLTVPYEQNFVQNVKSGGSASEVETLGAIAQYIIDGMQDDVLYFIGPGTTTRAIMERLSLPNTLLGVDVLKGKKLIARDVNEQTLLQLIRESQAKMVLTPIGGQGYLLGRGNQQFSPQVVRKVGKENIIVIAALSKIIALSDHALFVDTGDPALDQELSGYMRVITGYNEETVCRVL